MEDIFKKKHLKIVLRLFIYIDFSLKVAAEMRLAVGGVNVALKFPFCFSFC